ncbi:thiol reductant ABC exporter subunit CydD [Paenibacillus kandeliae]|uniref:thiol reductant ABC exporter subunit CydD n=1 Tax=Paenibacillus kandeliae TaxID=3231269 RepID=UPI003459BE74
MKKNAGLLKELMYTQRKRKLLLRLLSFALGVMTIMQAVLLAEAVQQIFVESASLRSWLWVAIALLVVMIMRTWISYINGSIGLNIAADAKRALRLRLLRLLASHPLMSARQGQTGSKISLALDTVDEADAYFSQYVPKMIEASIMPLMILIVVFSLHIPSGLILLFTAPFIPLFMALIGIQTKQKSEEKFQQLALFSGTFLDSLQGLLTLKLFGRTKEQQQKIEQRSLGYRDSTMSILKVAFTNTFALETIVMLGIGIVALELALQLVVFKTLHFHVAFLILLLVPEFYNMLKNMGTAFHGGRTSMGAIRNIEVLLNEANVQQNGSKEQAQTDMVSHMPTYSSRILPFIQSQAPVIEIQNVAFDYGAGDFQLTIDSLCIEPGQNIAIVGKSGAGKTTLLHLIAGLLPPSVGDVRINNQPLSLSNEQAWFAQIGYITQHPYIFAGTFADNIAIAVDGEVSRADIAAAAELAGLTELVAQLEHGYDTLVGEGGRGLSGGEKQRLALARAFLKKPSVLLFDEPTTGLDLHTERVLMRSIRLLSQHATVITIAHRLHTIRDADRILFMEQGKLQSSGTHEQLLHTAPLYAEMIYNRRQEVVG